MNRNAKLTSMAIVAAVVVAAVFFKPKLSGMAAGGDSGGCGGGPSGVAEDGTDYEEYDPSAAGLATTTKIEKIVAAQIAQKKTVADDFRIARAAEAGWLAGKKDGGRILAGLTTPIDGRWVAEGREPGMDSGQYLCSRWEAQVCTATQLIDAAKRGDFNGAPEGTFWFPRDREFEQDGTIYKPHESARCAAYHYPTADLSWSSWGRVQVHLWENGEPSTKEPSKIDVKFELGPADPRFDDKCLEDVEACTSYVPTGFACNERRSIPCCYTN